MISSAVVCASQTPVVTGLLKEFADGATGAFVSADGLSATKSSQGWRISGTSMPTIGVPGADIVVAHMPIVGAAEHLLVVIDPTHRGVSIETGENADLTRSAGRLHLRDYPAAAADVLADPRQPHIELIRNTLLAAEAAGVAQWCLDTTLAHIKQREQFGRPIGSFQAVQHKAALMLVHTELTRAAAWDAARAHDQPAEQQKLAAAQAAVTSLALARDVAVDAVLLLGGIGFTWEHDAHLYWRKAISLAAAGGATQRWATRLGELALTSARDYSFVDHTALPRCARRSAKHLTPRSVSSAPTPKIPASGPASFWLTRGWSLRTTHLRTGWVPDPKSRPSSLRSLLVEVCRSPRPGSANGCFRRFYCMAHRNNSAAS